MRRWKLKSSGEGLKWGQFIILRLSITQRAVKINITTTHGIFLPFPSPSNPSIIHLISKQKVYTRNKNTTILLIIHSSRTDKYQTSKVVSSSTSQPTDRHSKCNAKLLARQRKRWKSKRKQNQKGSFVQSSHSPFPSIQSSIPIMQPSEEYPPQVTQVSYHSSRHSLMSHQMAKDISIHSIAWRAWVKLGRQAQPAVWSYRWALAIRVSD